MFFTISKLVDGKPADLAVNLDRVVYIQDNPTTGRANIKLSDGTLIDVGQPDFSELLNRLSKLKR